MSAWHELKGNFGDFERTQDRIVTNSAATGADWRRTLINLRRQLQDSLVGMRAALRACEVAGADAALCRDFASALSEMRSALALHQAQWPAVAIDTADANYQRSLQDLLRSESGFRDTAHDLIEKLKS
jgi:hypothetical protein